MFVEAQRLGMARLREVGHTLEAMIEEQRTSRFQRAFRELEISLRDSAWNAREDSRRNRSSQHLVETAWRPAAPFHQCRDYLASRSVGMGRADPMVEQLPGILLR